MLTCQACKCTNKTGIYADTISWCFAASKAQKSGANEFIKNFAYDGGKFYFDLSYIIALLLLKDVFFTSTAFSSYIRPVRINFEDKNFESLIVL